MWSPRAWIMISVRWRCFSLVRMTCAEMALSLSSRSSLRQPPIDELSELSGDVDVTAGNLEAHSFSSSSSAASHQLS